MQPSCFEPLLPDGVALLDTGGGEKLEQFGALTLVRPDPQALWSPRLGPDEWEARADLWFERESDRGGRWRACSPAGAGLLAQEDPRWTLPHDGLSFVLRPTPFKHVGLFPEQASNWRVLGERRPGTMLNLFGYTGGASVVGVAAGWSVTHVDASKQSLSWAVENLEASGLGRDSMRVLCEDALRFAQREARRGNRYDLILLDPPHYGRGPKGEVWRLEDGLSPLVEMASGLLAPGGTLVLSTYAVGFSPLTLQGLLQGVAGPDDLVEAGELAIGEVEVEGAPSRLLPAGFCARLRRGAASA